MALVHIVRFLEYADQDDQLIRRLTEQPSAEEIAILAKTYGFLFTAQEWESLEEDMNELNLSYTELERLLEKMNP
ncbi:Nif11-like leader peptide family natural product precursor [Bacillus tianshenii]|nr:Nif11-like leader peptide family natural product precursor [Bacillus tianshenii]